MEQNIRQENEITQRKTQISIEYDGKIIAIEASDEESVEVSTIQNAFKCGEIKGLRYQKDGQTQK